jgi:hypothetical protein
MNANDIAIMSSPVPTASSVSAGNEGKKMQKVGNLLQSINADKKKYEEMILPPATGEAIDRIRDYARKHFQSELPEAYIEFLRRHDGLRFNNYSVYGATERKDPFIAGFIETNERRFEDPQDFVAFADTSNTLFAQERATGRWVALDLPPFDEVEEFDSFDAMLEHVLREAYE